MAKIYAAFLGKTPPEIGLLEVISVFGHLEGILPR